MYIGVKFHHLQPTIVVQVYWNSEQLHGYNCKLEGFELSPLIIESHFMEPELTISQILICLKTFSKSVLI